MYNVIVSKDRELKIEPDKPDRFITKKRIYKFLEFVLIIAGFISLIKGTKEIMEEYDKRYELKRNLRRSGG